MERKQYLMRCGEVSTLPKNAMGIVRNPPKRLLVKYDGALYYPLYYVMKFEKGTHNDVAVLRSLNANSILYVPLEKVGEYNGK